MIQINRKLVMKAAAITLVYALLGLNLPASALAFETKSLEQNMLSPALTMGAGSFGKTLSLFMEMRLYLPLMDDSGFVLLMQELEKDEQVMENSAVKDMIRGLTKALLLRDTVNNRYTCCPKLKWLDILRTLRGVDVSRLRSILPEKYMPLLAVVVNLITDGYSNTDKFSRALKNLENGFDLPNVRMSFEVVLTRAFLLLKNSRFNEAIEWFDKAHRIADLNGDLLGQEQKYILYRQYYNALITYAEHIYKASKGLAAEQKKEKRAEAVRLCKKAVYLIEEHMCLGDNVETLNYPRESKVIDLMAIIHVLEMKLSMDIDAGCETKTVIADMERVYKRIEELAVMDIENPHQNFIIGQYYMQYIDLKINLLMRLVRDKERYYAADIFNKKQFNSFMQRFNKQSVRAVLKKLAKEDDFAAGETLARDVYKNSPLTDLAIERFTASAGKLHSFDSYDYLIKLNFYNENFEEARKWLKKSLRYLNNERYLKETLTIYALIEPEKTKQFVADCLKDNLIRKKLLKYFKAVLCDEDKELIGLLVGIYMENEGLRKDFNKLRLFQVLGIEMIEVKRTKSKQKPAREAVIAELSKKTSALKAKNGKKANKPAVFNPWKEALENLAAEIEAEPTDERLAVMRQLVNDNFILKRKKLVTALAVSIAECSRPEAVELMDLLVKKLPVRVVGKKAEDEIKTLQHKLRQVSEDIERFKSAAAQVKKRLSLINDGSLVYSEAVDEVFKCIDEWGTILTDHEGVLDLSQTQTDQAAVEEEIERTMSNIKTKHDDSTRRENEMWIEKADSMEKEVDAIKGRGLSGMELLVALNTWLSTVDIPVPNDELILSARGESAKEKALELYDEVEAEVYKMEMICDDIIRLVIDKDADSVSFYVKKRVVRKFLQRFKDEIKDVLRALLRINPNMEIYFYEGNQENAGKVQQVLEQCANDVFLEMDIVDGELEEFSSGDITEGAEDILSSV